MSKRKNWKEMSKAEKVATTIVALVVAFIFIGIVAAATSSKSDTAAYTVVEEKDISIENCSRVTYKIKLADDTTTDTVKATEQKLIDDNKSTWNDITVWTYKNSESDEFIKNNAYTVDMAEYSTCK